MRVIQEPTPQEVDQRSTEIMQSIIRMQDVGGEVGLDNHQVVVGALIQRLARAELTIDKLVEAVR